MPHFVLEHSASLAGSAEIESAMKLAMECGVQSGFIAREDIKVRAREYDHVLFGDGRRSFIHITVHLLAGRTEEMRESLALLLRDEFAREFPDVESLSFDIVEMNPVAYKKRLSG